MTSISIHCLATDDLAAHLEALAEIVAETVKDGAAIGFLQPFSLAEVRAGRRLLFAAMRDGETVGSVQLQIALPANQPHRCEVAKMMVHPRVRRKGVGAALMDAVEARARALGRTLITLDTRSGDRAEALYRAAGFEIAGVIPNYALDPDGQALHATTYMYKRL